MRIYLFKVSFQNKITLIVTCFGLTLTAQLYHEYELEFWIPLDTNPGYLALSPDDIRCKSRECLVDKLPGMRDTRCYEAIGHQMTLQAPAPAPVTLDCKQTRQAVLTLATDSADNGHLGK